jgi:capsular exopolysaccharide synthesis family protein
MDERLSGFGEERGAVRFLTALREHWLLIALLVVVAGGTAIVYSATAKKRYEATASILISPVSSSSGTFLGFSLLAVGDSLTRPVVTAARFVTTPQVAADAAATLGVRHPQQLLKSITVTPVGQANIVTIVGKAQSPDRAALLANTFAAATISNRTAVFQQELVNTISRIRAQLAPIPVAQRNSGEAVALEQRLGDLQGLVGGHDPTLQLLSQAVPPTSAVWPRPVLSIAVAILAALLVGTGAAMALELVNPRVTREEELILEQRLPVLARVPRVPRKAVRDYLTGKHALPGSMREAYRTLRASLMAAGRDGHPPTSILITSASPSEGKTMTAVNIATALAAGGQRVVLVDGDLRRPMVATLFGVASRPRGFADVLLDNVPLEQALVPAPGHGAQLQLLLASPEHAHLVDLLHPERVERVLDELRRISDVVVIDSPPVTEVADALTLADQVDTVLIAVRLGRTRRDRLNELRRMLSQRGIAPGGDVLTLRRTVRRHGYYYGADNAQAEPAGRRAARRAARDRVGGPS